MQAFATAILTYDPRNPPSWRVVRANIGLDYAARFPQSVRWSAERATAPTLRIPLTPTQWPHVHLPA